MILIDLAQMSHPSQKDWENVNQIKAAMYYQKKICFAKLLDDKEQIRRLESFLTKESIIYS